jgi:hypothetical protein
MKPLVKIELENLKKISIIFSIRHLEWLSNLVVVWKNNGEIGLCVDSQDLNRASAKDNYYLLNMEELLQQVIGSALMSMLDGFSGYNQALVAKEDMSKIVVVTPWGTYDYFFIPFVIKKCWCKFSKSNGSCF